MCCMEARKAQVVTPVLTANPNAGMSSFALDQKPILACVHVAHAAKGPLSAEADTLKALRESLNF